MKLLPSPPRFSISAKIPFIGRKPGPTDVNLLEIAEKTGAILEGMEALSRKYVLRNVAAYNSLAAKARRHSQIPVFGENVDRKHLKELTKAVERLRDFFFGLEKKKPSVKGRIEKSVARLKELERELSQALEQEQRFRQDLVKRRTESQRLAEPMRNIRSEALGLRGALCEKRISMLADFSEKHAAVRPAVIKAGERIERFAFAVSENARLYDEAARTLAMRRDILDAFGRQDQGVQVSFAEICRDVEDGFDELKKMESMLLEAAKKGGNF